MFLLADYSKGFGGKYGVQTDRVDKSAKGWSEHSKTELHPSQTDGKKGFGGKFGVDAESQDAVRILDVNFVFIICICCLYIFP